MKRSIDPVPLFVICRIASMAHCSPRTVRRALAGERVQPVTEHAVRCACEALELNELLTPYRRAA